jgi:polyisoprenyl-teichoic acid--peptidoglycan teichoic acid transferase
MREFQNYTRGFSAARRKRWLWYLSIGVMAVLVLGLGVRVGALGYGPNDGSEAAQDRGDGSRPGVMQMLLGTSGGDEPMNVLVLGVDRRPPDSKEQQVDGTRSDTIMLVRLVPETGQVKLLSVPRDLLVEIEPGVEDRINTAYAYGGVEQTEAVVEGFTGIPIDHYAIVDFEGFEAVVDAMGGVEVDVEDEFPSRWRMGEGLQNLDGRRALLYARYRGTACGDLDRIERQQELVAALRSKALRWNTVTKVPEIVRVMNENVKTDLGVDEAISLGTVLIRRGPNARMTSNQLKGTTDTLANGNEVLVPDETANEAILDRFRSDSATTGRDDRTPGSSDSSSNKC